MVTKVVKPASNSFRTVVLCRLSLKKVSIDFFIIEHRKFVSSIPLYDQMKFKCLFFLKMYFFET